MTKNFILSLIIILAILSSCASETIEIRAVAEVTYEREYLIKWETFPPVKGTVKVFSSCSPNCFNLKENPITKVDAEKGFALVPPLNNYRTYFKLVFNDQNSIITTDRVILTDKLFNFRDFGGYNNRDGKQLKWGKLYRSSSLSRASNLDEKLLSELDIKTIVDLRLETSFTKYPPRYCQDQNVINIPLRGNSHNVFYDQILSEKIRRPQVMTHLQEVFYFFVESNTDYLTEIFNILLDEDNYPIVFACSMGKDRSAAVAAIILAALDVNVNTIIEDYLLSNYLIDYFSEVENGTHLDPQIQETLTALYSSHRETILYCLEKINQDYGSMDSFLENELQMPSNKRTKLKELLLYP